ncbi:dehydrodolichyl diphosphate synthase CPT3-like isoform X1 [Magnolia sinica]|uniref:dehydrodolichyl diphosphate synthase CPT3-like isoform X1 n=2 Tax=Magnolia sinica TaxID=86752 RepID=UPI002657EFC1|nr:dehydrodolichyl diphosphate synthase CPT3-like isoform X1 [Magnolia sinica]
MMVLVNMDNRSSKSAISTLYESICGFLRMCLFRVLAFGSIPEHIAFIMDGNRRFSRSRNLNGGVSHRVGFLALVSILQHCYELGVKYVTVYAFSIDNFNRSADEVESIMDLMQEKIEKLLKEESIVNKYGIKINFFGNLNLLNEPVRRAAERAMVVTAGNTRAVLSICVAYTCTDEIVHAVQESCHKKWARFQEEKPNGLDNDDDMIECFGKNGLEESEITVVDLERNMYTAECPDPDILVRTSGETRLSNFLLWQTTCCQLLSPSALWPEISLRHLVWMILEYQRVRPYLEKKKRL